MSAYDEDEADDLSHSTRRTFCAELMLTSAGLVLAGPQLTRAKAAQHSIAYPPRRIEGAEILLPGSCLYFNYPTSNDPAVLLRSSDGEYAAYSRRCSHAGCSVDFDPSSKCLRCPCHKGTFDARMGYVMFGPPRRPLDEIILQMRAGGQLWATGKSFGREGEVITESSIGGD
jgi:Rieske Fe-S protein